MKILREPPDLNAQRWMDWHILLAAEAEFSMLDIYGRFQRGLDIDVISTYTPGLAPGQLSLKARGPYPAPSGWLWLIRRFAAAINASDEFGSLHPHAQISAIPSRFFHERADLLGSAVLADYQRCVAGFVAANRRTILASKVLADFHVSPAPIAAHFVDAAEEVFRLHGQSSAISEVVIFL